jgi:NAD(P)-dependent dehydrogenase (short-subunit alcohol dehydrogenase family)
VSAAPDLAGRVALVTGGGSGIGLAVARAFRDQGMGVAICGRDKGRLESAVETLGEGALAVTADVSDEKQVAALFEKVDDYFGGLDVLVNNAGVGSWGPIEGVTAAEWDRVQGTNLRGAFLCARAAWGVLRARGGGTIVNIGSVASKEGFGEGAVYSASKFGLLGLSESLREEGIPFGIKVTTICPGYVATPMVARSGVPPEEMIRPEDVAATCLYLLSLSRMVSVPEVVLRRMAP